MIPPTDKSQPPYMWIKEAILKKIRSGEWRPGDSIPTEQELTSVFACSRMTVSRAMRELADKGVVERRRGVGTRVAIQSGRKILFSLQSIENVVAELGCEYRFGLVERKIAVPPVLMRTKLGLPPARKALHVTTLHFADDAQFQLEDRWINLDAVPEAAEVEFDSIPPGTWLIERMPWNEGEHVISAAKASKKMVKLLDLTDGDAVLVIERRTWLHDKVVTAVRLIHPGGLYRLRTTFSSWSAQERRQ